MARNDRYVRQNRAGGWDVVKEGHRRATANADTKEAAVARARDLTRREGGGNIRVLGKSGKIVSAKTVSGASRSRPGAGPSTARKPSTGAEPGTRTVNYGLAGGHLDPTEHLERARKTVLPDNWTVNYGLAGGHLDPTEHLERARKTVRGPVYAMDVSRPMGQKVAAAREVVAAGG